ncbi:hypothetical protein C8Q74DRAFT_1215512 [Fomes fomentarius]|nr:hypothetical protein C8Q74DRAFT_1215512 [Fomes fomentarius]
MSFMELLFRAFLLWFTIYTLSVCPEDEQLKSPVCRGLAEYRRLVIEPYFIPPIQQALAHPAVAPYIEKAKPYADYAIRTTKPIAARAHKEFDTRVVPQWKKRVLPLYFKYAVPQLLKLDAQTAPYRTRIEQEYARLLAPYVRRTITVLDQLQRKARPYVVLAAEKTHQGYQYARPYARPLWEKVKAILVQLAAVLGEQRRQFVDPHVKKIWDHVKELSGKPQSPSASQLRSSVSSQALKASPQISKTSAKVSSITSSVASSISSRSSATTRSTVSEDQPASGAVSEAVSSSAAQAPGVVSSALSSVSAVVSAASDAVSSSALSLASAASSVTHASPESASSVAEAVPSVASSLVESATGATLSAASEAASAVSAGASSVVADQETLAASSANLIPSSAAAIASATLSQALAEVSEVADSLPSIVASSQGQTESDPDIDALLSDPDLDLFKAELGLTEDFLEGNENNEAKTHEEEETEEQREEEARRRREQNAIDRANVVKRHTEWEQKVEVLIEESKETLRKSLVDIRKAAVTELKDNVQIKTEVHSLIEDAEKFLRGAEKYLSNLQKENRKPEEKRAVWERVVSKLEQKFSDRLRQTEGVVNGWYHSIVGKEAEEVKTLTEAVKDLAERGQADIGLDYAYLDDVTYQDWQRYHDLIRRSENFTVYAQSVQAGSHETSPTNPIVPTMQELQDEVEDVIRGFNARLRQVKRNGARSFGTSDAVVDEEDGAASILPIEEPAQTDSPLDEEVQAALDRVATPDEAEKSQNADAVAQSLKDAVASEETSATSTPLHEEL